MKNDRLRAAPRDNSQEGLVKLTLDYTQRLNLHAVLGAQKGTVDEVRAIWKLQDYIDLTPDERKKINYRVVPVNGMQQTQWDLIDMPPREFEFSPAEFDRISQTLKSFNYAGSDRRWLEPLLAQLDMIGEGRASKSHAAD